MDIKEFEEIQKRQRELFIAKNRAYGEKNISSFGIDGVIVRLTDKINRLKTLAYNKPEIFDEKRQKRVGVYQDKKENIIDTLLDISNYGTIGAMLVEGTWNKNENKD